MFNFLRKRKVAKLARLALAKAAEMYEDGTFEWRIGSELVDGDLYTVSQRPTAFGEGAGAVPVGHMYGPGSGKTVPGEVVYEAAVGGCLLGGIAKAAWLVCGSPAFGTREWQLKLDVESQADRLVIASITPKSLEKDEDWWADTLKRTAYGSGPIPSFNDHDLLETGDAVTTLRIAAQG